MRYSIPPEPPNFIKGTFLWDKYGYHYNELPPLNLFSIEALNSDNIWIVLASILERAKYGDHSYTQFLIKLLQEEEVGKNYLLLCIIAELLGDIGTERHLCLLKKTIIHGSDDLRITACRAMYWSGYLWLVPYMLEAWNRIEWLGNRDTISYMLSDLLEEQAGPIASNEAYTSLEYTHIVQTRWEELCRELNTDKVPVWLGKVFGVKSLAQYYYHLFLSSETPFQFESEGEDCRHKFEASTGINCSSFFPNEKFNLGFATEILANFLDSSEADRYEEGVRYFFGYQIPNDM